jgi:chromosome segregation ATPase
MNVSEKVAAAADAMLAEGCELKDVKNSRIQERVGGSFRDIAPALREWKLKQEKERQAPQPTGGLPEPLTQAVTRAAQLMWQHASSLAQQRVEAAEGAATQRVVETQTEMEDLIEVLSKRDEECARHTTALKERDETIEALRSENKNLTANLAAQGQRLSQMEELQRNLAKAEEEAKKEMRTASELRGELRALQQKFNSEPSRQQPPNESSQQPSAPGFTMVPKKDVVR